MSLAELVAASFLRRTSGALTGPPTVSGWAPSIDPHPENYGDPEDSRPPGDGMPGWRFSPVASLFDLEGLVRGNDRFGFLALFLERMTRLARDREAVEGWQVKRKGSGWLVGYASIPAGMRLAVDAKQLYEMAFRSPLCYFIRKGEELREEILTRKASSEVQTFPRSLGVPRAQMPQIKSTLVPDFLEELAQQGIRMTRRRRRVGDLKPTQAELNLDKAREMLRGQPEDSLRKPVIVSKDDYLLDGHHRWAALQLQDPESEIETIRVEVGIRELLRLAAEFSKVEYKTVEASSRRASDPAEVSQEILRQLGGMRRLTVMVGASKFLRDDSQGLGSIRFQTMDPGAGKPNFVNIILESDDTYTVKLGRARGMNFKWLKEFNGVYADSLVQLLERQTGLAYRL